MDERMNKLLKNEAFFWIMMIILWGALGYMIWLLGSNINLLKTDPCKLCEQTGRTCIAALGLK